MDSCLLAPLVNKCPTLFCDVIFFLLLIFFFLISSSTKGIGRIILIWWPRTQRHIKHTFTLFFYFSSPPHLHPPNGLQMIFPLICAFHFLPALSQNGWLRNGSSFYCTFHSPLYNSEETCKLSKKVSSFTEFKTLLCLNSLSLFVSEEKNSSIFMANSI